MRNKYPVPHGAVNSLAFRMRDDEDTPAFLIRCETQWHDTTGRDLGTDELQTTMFRKAVMEGMPKAVRAAMRTTQIFQAVIGLDGKDT